MFYYFKYFKTLKKYCLVAVVKAQPWALRDLLWTKFISYDELEPSKNKKSRIFGLSKRHGGLSGGVEAGTGTSPGTLAFLLLRFNPCSCLYPSHSPLSFPSLSSRFMYLAL